MDNIAFNIPHKEYIDNLINNTAKHFNTADELFENWDFNQRKQLFYEEINNGILSNGTIPSEFVEIRPLSPPTHQIFYLDYCYKPI